MKTRTAILIGIAPACKRYLTSLFEWFVYLPISQYRYNTSNLLLFTVSSCVVCAGIGCTPLRPRQPASELETKAALYRSHAEQRQIDPTLSPPLTTMKMPPTPFAVLDNPAIRAERARYRSTVLRLLNDPKSASAELIRIVHEVFRDEGIPTSLVALAFVESGLNPHARSPMGAVGLWQFMPATARRFGLSTGVLGDERKDPILSSIAAARYLKELYLQFQDWNLVLSAYNSGEAGVERLIKQCRTRDFWAIRDSGRLNSETSRFIPRVIAVSQLIAEITTPPLPLSRPVLVVANRRLNQPMRSEKNVSLAFAERRISHPSTIIE